jgi:hypothetical protein
MCAVRRLIRTRVMLNPSTDHFAPHAARSRATSEIGVVDQRLASTLRINAGQESANTTPAHTSEVASVSPLLQPYVTLVVPDPAMKMAAEK